MTAVKKSYISDVNYSTRRKLALQKNCNLFLLKKCLVHICIVKITLIIITFNDDFCISYFSLLKTLKLNSHTSLSLTSHFLSATFNSNVFFFQFSVTQLYSKTYHLHFLFKQHVFIVADSLSITICQ